MSVCQHDKLTQAVLSILVQFIQIPWIHFWLQTPLDVEFDIFYLQQQ